MTYQCRLINGDGIFQPGQKPQAGDMWFLPDWIDSEDADFYIRNVLSIHYMRDHYGKRYPMIVCLPDGHDWCFDQKSANGDGWTVTGKPPHITANPSILSVNYHGWLKDGVLSDDLEGRTYQESTNAR